MNRDEVIDLLATAAAYDRRTAGQADITAWHLAIGDLNFHEAQAAVVAHYTEDVDWLMPAHIRTRVKRARELRLAARPIPEPAPELTDDQRAYKNDLDSSIRRIADGQAVGKALTTGTGHQPSEEYTRIRGADRDPVRVAAMQVRCPWPPCQAATGSTCTDVRGNRLRTAPAHDARLVEAGLADWVEVNGTARAVIRGMEAAS